MKKKKNIRMLILAIAMCITLSGCTSIPKPNFYSWMFDLTKTKSELESILNTTGKYIINKNDYELFENIKGTLCIRLYNNKLDGWTWERYADEETYNLIAKSISKQFKTLSSTERFHDKGIDDAILYQAVPFEKNTYDSEWTIGDEKIEDAWDEETRAEKHHVILLLKKGDFVSVQYAPLNIYESIFGGINWYSQSFE